MVVSSSGPFRGEVKEVAVLGAVEGVVEESDQFRMAVLLLENAAENDKASCAAFAFSGAEAGLGAADLFLEVGALAPLSILKFFLTRLEILPESFLAGQQLLEFFLRVHGGSMVASTFPIDQ